MRNQFDLQLQQLHRELIKMGALCEEAISAGVKALLGTDALLRPARSFLPLFSVGMGWVVPALAGLTVGLILCRLRPLRS